jgi:integrase
MASITQRNGLWSAQVRRAGHPSITKSFATKTQAAKWARGIEVALEAAKYGTDKISSTMTLSTLIQRYNEEIGGAPGFGRSKEAVLKYLNVTLGHHTLDELGSDRICEYVTDRLRSEVSGVTVSIELTYLKVVLKVAADLWGIKGDIDAVSIARKSMAYKGGSTKSIERKRRPTQSEINRLVAYYTGRATQVVPMHDIIPFAVATAMRVGEICRITWGHSLKNNGSCFLSL